MNLTIKGRITKILELEKGTSQSGKEWQKQSFVIDTGDQYNPEVCFSIFGSEKVENFNKYNKVGKEVEVSFNVSSREYNGKYFHNLDAWKVFSAVAENATAKEDDSLPF